MQLIKPLSLMEQTLNSIRDAIFSGEFLPGEPLRELNLAGRLGVSQIVVREALVKLEHLGLVVRTANRGTIVTKLSTKELRGRLTVRIALEEIAFVEAASRITPQDIKELRRLDSEIVRAHSLELDFEATQSDLGFHRLVWECSDNEPLYNTLNQIAVPLFAFIFLLRKSKLVEIVDPRAPHEALTGALESGSARAIKKAIREHIGPSYKQFLESGIEDFQALVQKLA